jgi:glutaredoxin-like protein NrdH
MFDDLEFTEEDGTVANHEITVFALSTCGFCRRGLQFLRDNTIKFRFVYVDKLDPALKDATKKMLMDTFNERVVFPYLVLDNERVLTGFTETVWKQELLGE